MIKAIIFDVHGVLNTADFIKINKTFSERFKLNPEKVQDYFDNHIKDMLIGKESAEQFMNILKQEFFCKGDLVNGWKETYKENMEFNSDLLGFVKKKKHQYKMAVITNVTETRDVGDQETAIYEDFVEVLLSYKLKLVKPQGEIYKLVLDKLGIKGEEAVFIDDQEKHFGGAEELGIHTILFKNNEQLFAKLQELGVG